MPGLADMHVHLLGGWDGEGVDMLGYRRYLSSLLYSGITTVLDTGNVQPYVLQLRQEIEAGRLLGAAGVLRRSGDRRGGSRLAPDLDLDLLPRSDPETGLPAQVERRRYPESLRRALRSHGGPPRERRAQGIPSGVRRSMDAQRFDRPHGGGDRRVRPHTHPRYLGRSDGAHEGEGTFASSPRSRSRVVLAEAAPESLFSGNAPHPGYNTAVVSRRLAGHGLAHRRARWKRRSDVSAKVRSTPSGSSMRAFSSRREPTPPIPGSSRERTCTVSSSFWWRPD